MIKIKKADAPDWLGSIEAETACAKYVEWRAQSNHGGKSSRAHEPTPWNREEVKTALIAESNGKCIYCESKVRHVSFGDIEHLKPKSGFPELVLSWRNLGLVCQRCNNAKSNKWSDSDPIVSPFDDDPAEHLLFVGAFVSARTGRGTSTREHAGLMRNDLLEKRETVITDLALAFEGVRRITDPRHREIQLRSVRDSRQTSDEFFACFDAYVTLRSTDFVDIDGT